MKSTGKHLNDKQRYMIEVMLNEDSKLVNIADALNRDPRGIKYEIILHRYLHDKSRFNNKCALQKECKRVRLCNNCVSGKCKYCSAINCNNFCGDFTSEPRLRESNVFLMSVMLVKIKKIVLFQNTFIKPMKHVRSTNIIFLL